MCKREFILLLIIYVRNSSCIIDDLYNTVIAMSKLYSDLSEIEPSSHQTIIDINMLFAVKPKGSISINNQLNDIHERLNDMEGSLNYGNLSDMFKSDQSQIFIYVYIDKIEILARTIDESYNEFHQHRQNSNDKTQESVRAFMKKIYGKVMPDSLWMQQSIIEWKSQLPSYENLLHAISENGVMMQAQSCNGPELMAAFLYRLFRIVTIADIKANILLAFATIYMYPLNSEWKTLNSIARNALERQFVKYVNEFGDRIGMTEPLYLRACDPVNGIWIRDENFYELEGTFQSTIFRYHWTACKYSSCSDVASTPSRCELTRYSERSYCFDYSDYTAECASLGGIKACTLDSGPYKFQYLNSTKLGPLGRNFSCPEDHGHLINDGTGLDFIYSACVCNCYSNRNKISRMVMQSNVASNMVITGLRLIRKNQILYIQPREGKLDGHGSIRRYSERWISLTKNTQSSHIHSINKANRVFFFDDLRLPAYHVLTGIKFNKVTRGNETGFAIEIFGVPFDYESGNLYSKRKFLTSKQASNRYLGNELSFERVNSLYTTLPHSPSPANFNYVSLKRSKLRDDFGQSTLPLFDGVLVKPNPSTLLGGVGIFHKCAEGYAGFISLRIFSIKYGQFFKDFQSVLMPDGRLSFNYSNHDQIKMFASNSTSE